MHLDVEAGLRRFLTASDMRAGESSGADRALLHWIDRASSKNARPLPAHSSVAVIVTAGSFLIVERERKR